jgi:beta-N-acetylhexosaminidase
MNTFEKLQADKNRWVDNIMGSLTPEQKVGQLMVLAFYGPIITPDVVELVTKYNVGGLRITQKFAPGMETLRTGKTRPDFLRRSDKLPDVTTMDRPPEMKRIGCTAAEYAQTLNNLRQMAMDRPGSIPLHFTIDQEGEGADLFMGVRLFPSPMGLSATNDRRLIYNVALAVGKTCRAFGINMIHSPVLDVNTNPKNPEIGPRSYSDNPRDVIINAMETLKGFSEAGIIATAKHFPGRGESEQDAHFALPVVNLSREKLMMTHLAPYKALIEAKLPAIMAGFSSYPAFDGIGTEIPAATSRKIVTELLREELGFEGVITTDSIQMTGLLVKYEMGEAVVRCLQAGCDMILCRFMTPQRKYIIDCVIEAILCGKYAQSQLDASVHRILNMRWDMGLAENCGMVDASKAELLFEDDIIKSTATQAAEKSVLLLRNSKKLIPIRKNQKVLLIEQIHHFHSFINGTYSHPGILWLQMREHSENVSVVLVTEGINENDKKAVWDRLSAEEFDLIVSTSYYNYKTGSIMRDFIKQIHCKYKNLIVVANTPYEHFGVPNDIDTAIVTFCPSGRENIKAVADVLYGKLKPTAKLNIRLK